MKSTICFLALALSCAPAPFAAEPMSATPPAPESLPTPRLTTFNLDFAGGTPQQLIAAIEKASGKPVNAIIPAEYAEWRLPPMKMSGVTVVDLFQAMEQMTVMKYTADIRGNMTMQNQTNASFRSRRSPAEINDRTVWYFVVQGFPSTGPSGTRFYLLTPYLESGLTVDDITTAIQTGWKMRGENPVPNLSFHKETKLLIAVGSATGLDLIDGVLNALGTGTPKTPAKKP